MKTVFFILLGVCYCHCLPSVISRNVDLKEPLVRESFFDQKVRQKLEQLKDEMKSGIKFLNNTVLDPFVLEQGTFNLDLAGISGNLSIQDFRMTNLSIYDVKTAKFNLSTPWDVEVGLSWPGDINLKTKYDLDTWVEHLYHVYGRGELQLKIGNLQFYVSTVVNVGEEYLQIDIKNLNVNLDQLKLQITGLFDDDDLSDIVSGIISELVPDLLNDYQEEIVGFSLNIVQDYINTELKKVPIDTITGMIMG